MSTLKEALTRARSDAQELHKKVQAATIKDQAAIGADLKNASDSAQRLATSLKTIVDGQRGEAALHVHKAAAKLDDAAQQIRSRAMMDKVRDALQHLSEAVASQRDKKAA